MLKYPKDSCLNEWHPVYMNVLSKLWFLIQYRPPQGKLAQAPNICASLAVCVLSVKCVSLSLRFQGHTERSKCIGQRSQFKSPRTKVIGLCNVTRGSNYGKHQLLFQRVLPNQTLHQEAAINSRGNQYLERQVLLWEALIVLRFCQGH